MQRSLIRRVLRGKVWLVGAGPGDPELLTVKAARILRRARVLAYDELVSPEILALAPRAAERVAVGRRANGCRHHEARVHPRVIERALEGCDVVRIKGGDPLVFGRGGEEAEELAALDIPFEIVPGITAALAACASAGVPLTHRECASHVTLATARQASGDPIDLSRQGTLVFYMGLGTLEATLADLARSGRAPSTPAMVVSRATLPDQRIVTGTLDTLASNVRAAALEPPALVVVGDVVGRRVVSARARRPAEDTGT